MGKAVLRTKLCEMLDIEYPIMSAGMGPNTLTEEVGAPVDLVVAVSEAGGCGVLGASGYASRWTFYIGADGRIVDIDTHVRAASHGRDIVAKLSELGM